MKKLTYLLITALTLNSCYLFRENGIEVEIENNSAAPIYDVKFTTSEKLNSVDFAAISTNERVSDFLRMSENKIDGSYVLEFTRENGEKEISKAGYYTNGGSLDSRVVFKIEKDTVFASTSQY
ncbi:hypothetical protein [Pontibacter fetidus]|uniref:Lipoprotein n=1 Tax=Pontibacter fetidus TaxID=2700082 RepID=A0A6B2GZE6_9BACT|nr:hypothetical protein [Pontibacter fetidus]NDK55413.1 hypothetical protein [Pontibacter fetidus]